jgi:hypothetical protein
MAASGQPTDDEVCGKWMPRAKDYCARGPSHPVPCKSPEAMERQRQRSAERRPARVVTPEAKARWNRAHKFTRLGITEEQFNQFLEEQDYACAICCEPFEEERICADHDHNCCPPQPYARAKTCGKCVRGLLCTRCNAWLGWVDGVGGEVWREGQGVP